MTTLSPGWSGASRAKSLRPTYGVSLIKAAVPVTQSSRTQSDPAAPRLRAIAQGNRAELKALFDEEAPKLIAMAERILRRRDLAEDAVQDAFVRIWMNAAQYDPARGSERGWVRAIARNAALDMLRRSQREEPLESGQMELLQEESLRAELQGLEGIVERLDENGRLRGCLEALEPRRRQVVLMAYALGLTHGEIAGRLGAPLGTVKAWMRRSLHALRECLS